MLLWNIFGITMSRLVSDAPILRRFGENVKIWIRQFKDLLIARLAVDSFGDGIVILRIGLRSSPINFWMH